MDSEMNQPEKQPFNWIRFPLFLLIVVAIVLVLMLAMTGFDLQALKSGGLKGLVNQFSTRVTEAPTEREIGELLDGTPHALATVGDSLVYATISDLRCVGPDGAEAWYLPVSLQSPWLSVYERDILVADLGGRSLSVARDGNMLWEILLDEDIINARISRDYITVVTGSSKEGYPMRLRTFSRDGVEVSWRAISDYYPYMVVPVPVFSSELFVIAGFSANSLSTTAVVELMNPALEQKASIRGNDELFSNAWGMDTRHLIIAGEKRILCLDENLKTVWSHQPEGKSIAAAGVLANKWVVTADFNDNLYRNERKERTTLQIVDNQGKSVASKEIEGRVQRLTLARDSICLLVENQVLVLNDKAELINQMALKGIATEMVQANDDYVYVVSSNKLIALRTNYRHKFLGIF